MADTLNANNNADRMNAPAKISILKRLAERAEDIRKLVVSITGLIVAAAVLFATLSGYLKGFDIIPKTLENFILKDKIPLQHNTAGASGVQPNRNDTSEPKARTVEAGVFEGYVYYEVSRDGNPTDDGRLSPLKSGPMPDFVAVRAGDKFRILDATNIRANPNPFNNWNNSGFQSRLGVLGSKQCVQVVPGEKRPYPVQYARSGGWLPIIVISCP